MRVRIMTSLLAAAWLAAASAGAQEAPHLLADVNHSPYVPYSFEVREEPEDFFNLGGRLLFSTADPSSLDQAILWSTDGTAEGTRQVSTTLCLSHCESISPLGVVNGVALLGVTASYGSSSLARTDGTPGGTYLLGGDFAFDRNPQVFLMPGSGIFLFPTCAPDPDCRLWRSDTTRAGTGPFLGTDALPFVGPHAFSFWRGRLYFVAMHGQGGEQGLWSTDGTPAGTLLLQAVGEFDGRSARTVATPSHLFFTAGEKGEDLWATDGSAAGTLRVADFDPQPCAACSLPDVDSMTASGDRAYFETHRPGHAIEIWESDGTPAGTRPRIELPPRLVDASGFERVGGHWLFLATTSWDNPAVFWTVDDDFGRAARLTACDGGSCPSFYFPLSPPGARREIFVGMDELGELDPWVTDGTAAGTRRLAHVCPWACSWDLASSALPSPGGALLFHAFVLGSDVGTGEDELWRTDGTPGGTWRLAEHVDGFGILNGIVYYGSSGGPGHLGSELWATDGTAGNAHRIASLRRFEPGSAPVFQAFRDDALILTAKTQGQAALWRSDGTPQGTFPVHDFSSATRKVYASFLGAPGPLQFLLLDVQPTDPYQKERYELWRTDGTPEGTRAILGLSALESISPPIAWRGRFVFDRGTFLCPCALWSSDGTAAGTHQLLPAAPTFHCPLPLTALGADFLYTVPDGDGRPFSRLFRSDGTAAGTREIARLGGVLDGQPLVGGGTVFFRILSDNTSTEIWQTDGTHAGTHRATTLADPSDLQEFDGSLYLTAVLSADHDPGRALFRLPSSGGPPIQLAKLFQDSESRISPPVQFSPLGDRLLFLAQDFNRGLELWSTDGTPEGTRRLRSFQPIPDVDRQPSILAGTGDRVFFSASDGVHGWELWESDGTPEGTRMVTDLRAGRLLLDAGGAKLGRRQRFPLLQRRRQQNGPRALGPSLGATMSMRRRRIATLLLGSALSAAAGAQEMPHLLADINQTPNVPFSTDLREEPADFFNLGGRLLFSTADLDSLDQAILWSTDGTVRGTRQISTTLCLSACQSISALRVRNGVALLGIVSKPDASIFSLSSLGRTDGTPAGTYLLTGEFATDTIFHPLTLVPLPGSDVSLFYGCSLATGECLLWRSDGTREGTGILAGTDGLPFSEPHGFTVWQGRLYFLARHGEGGEKGLWSTDGSPAGTRFVHAVTEPPLASGVMAAARSRLFFTSGDAGEDLWTTDGSPAGTRQVADFTPPPCDDGCGPPDINSLTAAGDDAYFETHRAGHAIEIWESDGTTAGTRPRIELPSQVADVEEFRRIGGRWSFLGATEEGRSVFWTVDDGFLHAARLTACGGGGSCPAVVSPFTAFSGDRLLFAGIDSTNRINPWITDGTSAGTRRLVDCPGGCNDLSFQLGPSVPPGPAGAAYFRAYTGQGDPETGADQLWSTDGTPEGTRPVAGHFAGFGVLNGRLYFGSSGQWHPASELWVSDGTPESARRVAVLRRLEPGSSPQFQPFQDGVLLTTADDEGISGLWKSDGTPQGTFPLFAFSRGAQPTGLDFLGEGRSFQLLALYLGDHSEVWRTDGTVHGTRAVARLPGVTSRASDWNGKTVLVVESVSGAGDALWISDGTGAGTRELVAITPPSYLTDLAAFGSRIFFSAQAKGGATRSRLFVADATPAGAREIARFPGIAYGFIAAGGTVLFEVSSDDSAQVWRTDGTAAGTKLAWPLADTADLQLFGDSVYLTAAISAQPEDGRGLFRVPLASGDPVLLARVFPLSYAAFYAPVRFVPIGDRLLFTLDGREHGFEIWTTDGTSAGTRRVRHFRSFLDPFQVPESLAAAGGRAFFAASDGVHGRELWESDGTPEGTRMVIDLAPGGFSSLPQSSSFAVANGFLFFSADDGKTGLEPWALPLEPR